MFGYPKPTKKPEKKEVKLAPTAQLSTSKKEKEKEKKKKGDKMDVDEETPTPITNQEIFGEKKEKKEEEKFEILQNPARVTLPQMKYLTFDVDKKYKPIKSMELGIILLSNFNPDENETIIELKNEKSSKKEDKKEDIEPPKDFQFDL
jgi:hypothetical protein